MDGMVETLAYELKMSDATKHYIYEKDSFTPLILSLLSNAYTGAYNTCLG